MDSGARSLGSVSIIRVEILQTAANLDKVESTNKEELFFEKLEKIGYKIKKHLHKDTGEIRGYGFEKDNCYYNASDLGKDLTLKKLFEPQQRLLKGEGDIKRKFARVQIVLMVMNYNYSSWTFIGAVLMSSRFFARDFLFAIVFVHLPFCFRRCLANAERPIFL